MRLGLLSQASDAGCWRAAAMWWRCEYKRAVAARLLTCGGDAVAMLLLVRQCSCLRAAVMRRRCDCEGATAMRLLACGGSAAAMRLQGCASDAAASMHVVDLAACGLRRCSCERLASGNGEPCRPMSDAILQVTQT